MSASPIAAGLAAVAVTFGLARYGYGLLLPDLRADLRLSALVIGLVGSGAYAAYLAATAVTAWASTRYGPRPPVATGVALAAVGMGACAGASGPWSLGAGVALGGASAGFVFPPYADVIEHRIAEERRPRALALVSSGTGWGVALAVAVAVVAGDDWRAAWVAFAVAALGVAVWALVALPEGRVTTSSPPALRPRWFVCPRSGPLLASAFAVGLAASLPWTYAVDFLATEGAGRTTGRTALAAVGIAGVAGSFAGDLASRAGLRTVLGGGALLLGASIAGLVVAPESATIIAAAAGFGATYNLVVAGQVLWSGRVFGARPSAGAAAVMFALAIGLVAGPALAGALLAAGLSYPQIFVGAGVLAAGTAPLALAVAGVGSYRARP